MSRLTENDHIYPVASPINPTLADPMATGTHKVVIKSNPDAITTTEKSSFHNPITGISQKLKVKTRTEKRSDSSSSSDLDRSRSSSHERKMRNLAYQDLLDRRPIGEQHPMPLGNLNNIAPSDLDIHQISRKKATVTQKDNRIITKEKLYFIDPITGRQENTKVKTETIDHEGQNINGGKSKSSYDYKIKNTPQGPEEVIKMRHREGGVRENLRNKLQNIMNNGF